MIDRLVVDGIFKLLAVKLPPYLNEERLLSSYMSSYRGYFKTLRDVARFSNLFAFNYARAGQKVDIGDLASITALEAFERRLHRHLGEESSYVLDTVESIMRQDRSKPNETRLRIEGMLDQAECTDRALALEVLRDVFEKVDLAYKGQMSEPSSSRNMLEARTASQKHFPLFFNMGLPPSEISDDEYHEAIMLSSENTEALLSELERLCIDKVVNFISRLSGDSSMGELIPSRRVRFIVSMLALEQRFAGRIPIAPLRIPFHWTIGYALTRLLSKLSSDTYVVKMGEAAEAVAYGVGALVLETDRIVRFHGKKRDPALSDDQILSLQESAIRCVRRALAADGLSKDTYLGSVLGCLSAWGINDLVDEIMNKMRRSPNMLIMFLKTMCERGGFEGVLQPKSMRFALSDIEKFISRDEIIKQLQGIREANDWDPSVQQIVRDFLAQHANVTQNGEAPVES